MDEEDSLLMRFSKYEDQWKNYKIKLPTIARVRLRALKSDVKLNN